MKIFFISDIHGSLFYLEKALQCYNEENANYIVILGDALYHGPIEKLDKIDIHHIINNLIPVTIGNIVGGGIFVGLAYWVIYKQSASKDVDSKQKIAA